MQNHKLGGTHIGRSVMALPREILEKRTIGMTSELLLIPMGPITHYEYFLPINYGVTFSSQSSVGILEYYLRLTPLH